MISLILSIAWVVLGLVFIFKFWVPWIAFKCRKMSIVRFFLINWAASVVLGLALSLPLCLTIIGNFS